MTAPVNPVGPKPVQPSPFQPLAGRVPLEQILRNKADELLKMGFFGKKFEVKLDVMPNPNIVLKQVQVNQALQAFVSQMIVNLEKPKKEKSIEELEEELKQLEEAMDEVDKCLEEISKLGPNSDKRFQSKEDHLRFLLERCEEYYDEFKEKGGDPQDLGLFTAVFYEKISKSEYNKATNQGALITFFKVPQDKPISPLLGDLMFNYILDLCLSYSKSMVFDAIAPLKPLKKAMEKRPAGIPNLYANMIAVQDEHRSVVCEKLAMMSVEFPFHTVMPVILGSQGLKGLAEWCWDLFFSQDVELSDQHRHTIEQLIKAFTSPFIQTLSETLSKQDVPAVHHGFLKEHGILK
jgi:mannitol/fructose-specific phosphotransferase system IIA component (Ntr-type)